MKLEKIVEHKNKMTLSEKSFFDAKSFAKIEESNDNNDYIDDEHLATKTHDYTNEKRLPVPRSHNSHSNLYDIAI